MTSLLLLLASACSSDPDPTPVTQTTCPNDLPDACGDTHSTWDTGMSTLVEARCATCHRPGGQEAFRPLTTLDEVQKNRSAALNQIYACKMPPSDGQALTSDERAKLLEWFVCGAP